MVAAVLVALGACSKASDDAGVAATGSAPAPATAETAPPADPSPNGEPQGPKLDGKERPGGGAVEQGAVALPVMKSCLRDCVARGSASAQPASQLETDCRRSCLVGCLDKCNAESEARSPALVEGCRQDCTRQIEMATL
jgi:hypothetical protein